MVEESDSAGGDGAGEGARKRKGDTLGANSEIGRKLKQYFEDVVSEGVPDRFAQLLSQLERTDPPPRPARGKD